MRTKYLILLLFVFLGTAANQISGQAAATTRSKTDPVAVGETAPDFSLADQAGKKVRLSGSKNPTVLVFYRGYW